METLLSQNFAETFTIQLSPSGSVNSGGYIPRRKASRYISTALHRIYQIRWIKKCRFINGHNFFRKFRETTRHFSVHSQNSEYPTTFSVTGANQNARKLLSTDLVNTKIQYSSHMIWLCYYDCTKYIPNILSLKLGHVILQLQKYELLIFTVL